MGCGCNNNCGCGGSSWIVILIISFCSAAVSITAVAATIADADLVTWHIGNVSGNRGVSFLKKSKVKKSQKNFKKVLDFY